MAEKNKTPDSSKEKVEQHKKSTDNSKEKNQNSEKSQKEVHKTGTKYDDWNDPTGNTHLSDKS